MRANCSCRFLPLSEHFCVLEIACNGEIMKLSTALLGHAARLLLTIFLFQRAFAASLALIGRRRVSLVSRSHLSCLLHSHTPASYTVQHEHRRHTITTRTLVRHSSARVINVDPRRRCRRPPAAAPVRRSRRASSSSVVVIDVSRQRASRGRTTLLERTQRSLLPPPSLSQPPLRVVVATTAAADARARLSDAKLREWRHRRGRRQHE